MRQDEIEEAHELAQAIRQTISAWRTFKHTHEIADAKVCCCEYTNRLFEKLDGLERQVFAREPR